MIKQLREDLKNYIVNFNPLTNVYGLARTFIALGTLLTLLFNSNETLFKPMAGVDEFPRTIGVFNIFKYIPHDDIYINIVKVIFIVILLLVISGWRPRYTGILHWYVTYNFHNSVATLDGGDQVALVITFLLIPITIVDHRKSHWKNSYLNNIKFKAFSSVFYLYIRLQVAILYLHATVAKLFTEEWRNGTAVYYYLNDPMLGLNNFFLKILNPILESPLVVAVTWGTLILQFLVFGALFAPKTKWNYYLLIAILMHEIFALMLGLFSFSSIMIGALIIYLRPLEEPFNFKGGAFYKVINWKRKVREN